MPFCHLRLVGPKPPPEGYVAEPVTLGERLRNRRCELGLLQREVGQWVGVSADTIRNWETGRTKPAVRFIPRIADFLGESPFGSRSEADGFPDWLTLARRRLGLTQRELAGRLGVDPSTVGHWERGEHRPIRRQRERVEAFFEAAGFANHLPTG